MYAGKGYNGNPKSTKRSKLDRVAPVGNRPPTHKNGGLKQWCGGKGKAKKRNERACLSLSSRQRRQNSPLPTPSSYGMAWPK